LNILAKVFVAVGLATISLTSCSNSGMQSNQSGSTSDPIAQVLYSQIKQKCGNVSDLSIQPDGASAQDASDPNYYRYLAKAAGQAVRVQVRDVGSQYYIYGDHNFTNGWGCVQDSWITNK
jgi:hypothetical protein